MLCSVHIVFNPYLHTCSWHLILLIVVILFNSPQLHHTDLCCKNRQKISRILETGQYSMSNLSSFFPLCMLTYQSDITQI